MTLNEILSNDGKLCACGRRHYALLKNAVIEAGAINKIPMLVKNEGAKSVFLLCDLNTYDVAGERVESLLKESGIEVKKYVFPTKDIIEPKTVLLILIVLFIKSTSVPFNEHTSPILRPVNNVTKIKRFLKFIFSLT